MAQSNKMISKLDSMNPHDQPDRNFKKNRNLSTTSQNTAASNGQGLQQQHVYSPQGQNVIISSNGLQMGPIPPLQNNLIVNNSLGGNNMMLPVNNKGEGKGRAGEDHRLVIEGVRLTMEII